jgi:GAF domain-containing protein
VTKDALEGVLRLLDRIDLAPGELKARLDEAVDGAQALLDGDGGGLMLLTADGHLTLTSASNAAAAALERAQERNADGPGIESTRRRAVVSVADLTHDTRWPELATYLADHGVRSVLAAPIWLRGRPAGNLNVLGREPREWSSADAQALAAYAGVITAYLRIALDADHDEPVVNRLREAVGPA